MTVKRSFDCTACAARRQQECAAAQLATLLAQNLRALREERNLSLAGLSDLTGVSKSMLRQIETGQSSPTIATLWRIANGLRVPFSALLKKQDPQITVSAFAAAEPLTGESQGYRLYPLSSFDPKRSFETYYVEIDPGTWLDAEPHQGQAEERVFVLQGTIAITVNIRQHLAERNHVITFPADCAHSYHNPGTELASAIMLISYLA
jgi:transcriptional regulator with XRE-family HTH domain